MTFTAQDIKNEELRLRYIELLQRPDVYPTRANWQYITKSNMRGLCRLLYGKYLTALTIGDADRDDLHDVAVAEFPKYLAEVDLKEAIDAVYGDIDTDTEASIALIRECGLFDAKRLAALLVHGRIRFVLEIIDVYRREYDETELLAMKRLAAALDDMPQLGHIEERQGIFGKQVRYICPEGHSNPVDNTYCSHCGLDIHGLAEGDYSRIDALKKRIEALESLLDKDS